MKDHDKHGPKSEKSEKNKQSSFLSIHTVLGPKKIESDLSENALITFVYFILPGVESADLRAQEAPALREKVPHVTSGHVRVMKSVQF